jgi:hypothetical protein
VPAALAAHPDRLAAAFFALLVLAYLWPVLAGGKILSPISVLYRFPPWQGSAPSDVGSYSNELLSDIPFADYPWRFFARALIRDGTLPLWNPHVFAGTPFFNNPQTGIFSPFSIPLWVLSLNYGIGVAAALKLWFGGFGTYLLVRQLRLGFLPGLLAGTSYAFCSMNIVWLTHETLPAVAVMLPWMLWLIERIFERGRLGSALWLALVAAVALGGGHPGMQLHVMAGAALYAVVRAATLPARTGSDWRRPLALAGGGLALGALLMGAMLIPEALSSHGTLGTVARQGARGSLPGSQMSIGMIRTPLFPDWWGRPSGLEVSHPPIMSISDVAAVPLNYNERTFYAGVVPLLLAAVALVMRGGWRRKAPLAVLAFVGLAIPFHFPGLFELLESLPGFSVVQNQRLHFLFELGVAVLAAFGLQAVLERPRGDRARAVAVLVAVAVGLVAAATIRPDAVDLQEVLRHFETGIDVHADRVIELTSVAWYLLLVVGAAAAMLVAWRWPRRVALVGTAILALTVLDMLHFAHGYQPMGQAAKVIPPRTPAIAFLQRHASEGRIAGIGYSLPNDWSLTYGLDDVRGYDPPQPTLRFYRLWQVANPEQINWISFSIPVLGSASLRVMSALGVRYVVSAAGTRLTKGPDPAFGALHVVYRGRDAVVLGNDGAAPRALVPSVVRSAPPGAATRAAMVAPGFDPRRLVVVERGQPGLRGVSGAHGTVAITGERNARVTLRASLDRRGLVVLNDDFTEGWSVRVDGRPARALHVDAVMRGVVVGPGRHEVVWSYAVPGMRAGAALSALALAGLLGAAVALGLRRRGVRRPAR